jgi:hypothetical protein
MAERKIPPINVPITPPDPKAVLDNHLADGTPIYRTTRPWFRNVEDKDANGNPIPVYRPGTNEVLYNRRRLESGERVVFMIPNNEGNGNLSWHEYRYPTEAEVAETTRKRQVGDILPALAGALLDRGLSVDQLLDRLTAREPEQAPKEPEVIPAPGSSQPPERTVETATYPKWSSSQKAWELSNGDTVKGNKAAAVAAEAEIANALDD